MQPVKVKKFSNGLKVILVPHRVGSVTACLRGLAGSNNEKLTELGAAHLLEHLLTFKSKNFFKEGRLRNIVLQKGGRTTGTTSRDDVAYLVKTLKEDYQRGLLFLSEIFFYPVLDKKDFEKSKKIVTHEILQNMESPSKHLSRISYRLLYPGQRFSKLNTGNIQDIDHLSLEILENFREKYYHPRNFVLSVCGDLNEKEFFNQAEKYFSHPADNQKNKVKKPKHLPNKLFGFQIENRLDISQLYLKIDYHGYTTSDKKKYSAFLLARYLDYKLKQIINSSYDQSKLAPYSLEVASFSSHSYGLFSLFTTIKPKDLKNFLYLYHLALNRILRGNINDSDLKYIKLKLKADFEFTLEKTSLRADYYSELFLYDQISYSHSEEIKNYLSVTKKEILNTAGNLFSENPKVSLIDKNMANNEFSGIWNAVKVEI